MNKIIKQKHDATLSYLSLNSKSANYELIHKKILEMYSDNATIRVETMYQLHTELQEMLDNLQLSMDDKIDCIGAFYYSYIGNINPYVKYVAINFPEDLNEVLEYIGTRYAHADLIQQPDYTPVGKHIIELIFKNGCIDLSDSMLELIMYHCFKVDPDASILSDEIKRGFFETHSDQIKYLVQNTNSIFVAKVGLEEFGYDVDFHKLLLARLEYCLTLGSSKYWRKLSNELIDTSITPTFSDQMSNGNFWDKLNFGDEAEDKFFFDHIKAAHLDEYLPEEYMKEIYKSAHLEKFLNINPNVINFKKLSKIYFIFHLNAALLEKYFDINQLLDIVGTDTHYSRLSDDFHDKLTTRIGTFEHNVKFTNDLLCEAMVNVCKKKIY